MHGGLLSIAFCPSVCLSVCLVSLYQNSKPGSNTKHIVDFLSLQIASETLAGKLTSTSSCIFIISSAIPIYSTIMAFPIFTISLAIAISDFYDFFFNSSIFRHGRSFCRLRNCRNGRSCRKCRNCRRCRNCLKIPYPG